MSFAEGFSAGVQLGNSIKQDRRARAQQDLDKTVQEWRVKQAADELALSKEMAAQRAQQATAELDERRKGREWGESLDEYMAQYKKDRDTVADQRYANEDARSRQSAVMKQLDNALDTMRKNRMDGARIKAMQGRGGNLPSTTMTEDLDPETGAVTGARRVTRMPGLAEPAGAQPGSQPKDPTAMAAQKEIDTLEGQNAQDRLNMAKGKDPYWFTNPAAEIAKRNQTIGRLQPLTGQGAASPGTAVPVQQMPQQGGTTQLADPQAAQALAWARANPNDPRAAAILARLQSVQR